MCSLLFNRGDLENVINNGTLHNYRLEATAV